jgi:flagellar FliL protein
MAEKSSNKSLIIIVAVVVVLQMIFTFAFMTFILKKNNAPVQQVVQNSEENHSRKSSKKSKRHKKSSEDDDKDYIKDYTVYSLGDIVVNIPGEETHYLVVTIAFEYQLKDKKLPDELKNKDVLIKDKLNSYFAAKNLADLQDITKREKMKEDILEEVNQMLLEGEITKVLFAQFVIQ